MPTDSGTVGSILFYDTGMIVHALPPVTIYENGHVLVLDVISRTEMSDELVVLEVAE